MSYNTKNYMEQGGEKLVIGGKLEVLEGATVTGIVKAATATKLGAVKAAARTPETDTVEVKIGTDGKLYVPTYPADLPFSPATADDLGCVIAAPAGETDTVEAKIGADNKLYVPAYPVVPEIPVAANIPASEATTVALLLADFNALLTALKTAGIMAADEPIEGE